MLSRRAGTGYTLHTMSPSSTAPSPGGHASHALRVAVEYQKSPLDPVDRFSEIIFGLIMVLTFTGAMSVAQGGQQEVRQMLVAALACNVAWGLVDGVMYVFTSMAERSRRALVLRGIRAAEPAAARAILAAALPEAVAAVTDESDVDRMISRIRALPEPPGRPGITGSDLRGALGSCLLVVLATFPPTIPFLLVEDAARALRISNGVAVVSLFLAGFWLARSTGARPWILGPAMVALGAGLVGLTIALGG
jgi:VIT1/CCC1 family predicted Fe2+/Mn2+ transporter